MTTHASDETHSPSATTEDRRDFSERRKEARYIPVKRSAYLGWWEGETFRSASAWVESLSRSGAVLLLEGLPQGDRPVWLCLIGSQPSDWHPAVVVDRNPSAGAGHVVRIELKESLAYDLFKTIGWGLPDESSSLGPDRPAASGP